MIWFGYLWNSQFTVVNTKIRNWRRAFYLIHVQLLFLACFFLFNFFKQSFVELQNISSLIFLFKCYTSVINPFSNKIMQDHMLHSLFWPSSIHRVFDCCHCTTSRWIIHWKHLAVSCWEANHTSSANTVHEVRHWLEPALNEFLVSVIQT